MRRLLLTLTIGASLLAPVALSAQSLAARVAAAPADATVRFAFQPKPGVCGDGESLMIRGDGARDGITVIRHGSGAMFSGTGARLHRDGRLTECREGPVVVELTRSARRITAATARIGGRPEPDAVDLGTIAAAAAVEFLLAEETLQAERRAAEHMIFTATLTPVETWPALLRIARSSRIAAGPRGSAMFWLAQAAGDSAAAGIVSIIGNDSDELEVRKQAVFALSRIGGDEAVTQLMRIARTNAEPEIRRHAMFWLGRMEDPRVVDFFERVLAGTGR